MQETTHMHSNCSDNLHVHFVCCLATKLNWLPGKQLNSLVTISRDEDCQRVVETLDEKFSITSDSPRSKNCLINYITFSNVVHTRGSSNIQLWKITHQQAKQYVFTVIIIYKLKIPIQH